MPIVLVHGVPETAAIWRPLIAELGRDDVITLSPPGFGAPVPAGFGATRSDYVDWLAAELEAIDGPVDLVGHDWGGGHTVGLVCARPELVRSWASDVCGLFHPLYEWHDMAQSWQTPEVGEQTVAMMMGMPATDKVALFESMGMPADVAADVAAGNDETMGACVLSLYRSALRPELDAVAEGLPNATTRPGLAIIATEDTFVGSAERATEVATRAGATTATLEGASHWWMLDSTAAAAAMLTEFWADLD